VHTCAQGGLGVEFLKWRYQTSVVSKNCTGTHTHTRMHTHTHTHTYAHAHARTHTHTHAHARTHIIDTHTLLHTHTLTRSHLHTFIHARTRAYTHTPTHRCGITAMHFACRVVVLVSFQWIVPSSAAFTPEVAAEEEGVAWVVSTCTWMQRVQG